MTAMKCDRCGKYYDQYYKENLADGTKVDVSNAIILAQLSGFRNYIDRRYYDLCPECMAKLKEFLVGSDYDEEHNTDSQDA